MQPEAKMSLMMIQWCFVLRHLLLMFFNCCASLCMNFLQSREEKKIQAFVKMFEEMEKAKVAKKESNKAVKLSVKPVTKSKDAEQEQCSSAHSSLKAESSCEVNGYDSDGSDVKGLSSTLFTFAIGRKMTDSSVCFSSKGNQLKVEQKMNKKLHAKQPACKPQISKTEETSHEEGDRVEKSSCNARQGYTFVTHFEVDSRIEAAKSDTRKKTTFGDDVSCKAERIKSKSMDELTDNNSKMCLRSSGLVKNASSSVNTRKVKGDTLASQKLACNMEEAEMDDGKQRSDDSFRLQRATAARKRNNISGKDKTGTCRGNVVGMRDKMKEIKIRKCDLDGRSVVASDLEVQFQSVKPHCAGSGQRLSGTKNASTLYLK